MGRNKNFKPMWNAKRNREVARRIYGNKCELCDGPLQHFHHIGGKGPWCWAHNLFGKPATRATQAEIAWKGRKLDHIQGLCKECHLVKVHEEGTKFPPTFRKKRQNWALKMKPIR